MALEADLAACLAETSGEPDWAIPSEVVTYFQPNGANLVAVVACVVRMPEGSKVLMEFVVTVNGTEHHLSLEGMSRVGRNRARVASDA